MSHYPPIVKLGEFFDENLFDHVRISNHEKWLTEQEHSKRKKKINTPVMHHILKSFNN